MMAARVDTSGVCLKCRMPIDDHGWAQVARANGTWRFYCPQKRRKRVAA